MSDKIYPPDPQEADTLLASLLEEVKRWEGTLAGGTKLGVGAAAVESLVQTKVEFGNPRNHLILLTEEIFKDIGVELNSIYRQQMRDVYDFYYMTVTVDLRPKPGARFSRLRCELVFSSEGENEPIVDKIFPNSKWRTVMNWGVGMNLGLNGNLDWDVKIDASQVAEIANLPGNLKANVASNNELKAFIVVSDYAYEVGGFEILAQGEGNSTCYWRIEEPDIQKMATVKFAIVFKVSKGTESINLRGIAWAEPNKKWLISKIRNVFSKLSDIWKNRLQSEDEPASKLAELTASEVWTLDLAKATIKS